MLSPEFIALIAGTFAAAGFIKGVVGLGLPTVSLAILTATIGLRDAMALMLIPSLLTNVWQMLTGPYLADIFRRFWLLGSAAIIGTFLGLKIGVTIEPKFLAAFLGVVIVVYAASGPGRFKVPIRVKENHLLGACVGFCSGLITGLAGVFLIPTVLYLQGIRLGKDVFVQTLGMLFTIATVTLGVALARHELLSAGQAYVSAGAVVPAILGMIAGQKVRARLSEDRFRTVLFWALGGLGGYLILRVLI